MKLYWFILIWVSMWGILSSLYTRRVSIKTIDNGELVENRTNIVFVIAIFSGIILLTGLRSGVADTTAYIEMFNSYPTTMVEAIEVITDENAREPGFRLLSILFKSFISQDYHVWLFTIALITGTCIMIPLYKYSCNFGISAFLFIASCQFTWMLNGMRQFLVASVMFAFTHFILEKKTTPYIMVVLLLSTIHISLLIMIPVYFIVRDDPWQKKNILFMVLIILAMIFADRFTNVLTEVVEDTNYSTSVNEFKDADDGTNSIRILVEAVPTIIAFIYRKKIKEKATPIINISINMSMVATGLYIISKIARSGVLLGRLPIYFSLYNLILLPWLLENVFEKNEKRLIIFSMIVCYVFFFYYQMDVIWGIGYVSDILHMEY